MTILATTMGCSFLIVLASIGFGLQGSIMDEATSYQSLTEISIYGKEEPNENQRLSTEDVNVIEQTEHVAAVLTTDYLSSGVTVSLNKEYEGMTPVELINMDKAEQANVKLLEGDYPISKDEVIVGYDFREVLIDQDERPSSTEQDDQIPTYEGELLGETIQVTLQDLESGDEVETYEFTIVGVKEEPTRDWIEDNGLYISQEWKEEFLTVTNDAEERFDTFDNVAAHVGNIEHVESVTSALKEHGFYVYSISEEISNMNLFFNAFKAGLIFVGTIAVLIASIGIFNTMTMAVTERTHEIGVMKALGANPAHIKKMFLMESAYIGIIGSIFGVLISYVVSYAANFIIPLILESVTDTPEIDFVFSSIPIELVIISVLISVGVAMISGYRPASKATNVNVLSALRREA